MRRRADEPCYSFKPQKRTTQIIFGERQNLRAVLVSIRNFRCQYADLGRETETLHRMIDTRTAELHHINPRFDEQLQQARDAEATPEQLARISQTAPEDDWLLLRIIAEHPRTPAEVLARWVSHPYDAVRQNIARHANADGATLERLAADPRSDIWWLVACNQATPPALRERLQARLEGVQDEPAPAGK
jgi:hypothetical protein